ncbi:hypothetical protein HYW82_02705 [Candidatus Peregrinibacteria bacterium]|nr:hypothetical protein [Candidatus Peregrinibacteria bacterium]
MVLFLGALAWVAGQLFFEKELEALLYSQKGDVADHDRVLKIVTPFMPEGALDPAFLNPANRDRLINVYEPLVRVDKNLRVKPALAVSWGMIDELTWDFRLRSGVLFHDGSAFTADDVLASYEQAIDHYSKSDLRNFLNTIDKIEVVDDLNVKIRLKRADPLILQKLSLWLIIPQEDVSDEKITFSGTGPYKLMQYEEDGNFIFERFKEYWGGESRFKSVEVFYEPDKEKRVAMLLDGRADFLDFVPGSMIDELKNDQRFTVFPFPALGVGFIFFDMSNDVWKNPDARLAVALAINKEELVSRLSNTLVRPAGQFVGNGVFGFNEDIFENRYNLKKARALADKSGLVKEPVYFEILDSMSWIGDYLQTQMKKIGVELRLDVIDNPDFLYAANQDISFLSYKTDLGDSSDFLAAVAVSDGMMNIGGYKNKRVDELLRLSLETMDPEARLKLLKEAMKIIIVDDPLGVPLFEDQTIYAFRKELKIEPRIDGLIYFDDLIAE